MIGDIEDWKYGYYKAILNYLRVPDRDIIDLYTVEVNVDDEDAYIHMYVNWKDPVTGRTQRLALDAWDVAEFLRSI